MLNPKGTSEKFKGVNASQSPTLLQSGVFSFCSGGVPQHGSLARIPGKSLLLTEPSLGGIISIAEFGKKIVVQYFGGVVLYSQREIFPVVEDYVYDNEENLVVTNTGQPVIN